MAITVPIGRRAILRLGAIAAADYLAAFPKPEVQSATRKVVLLTIGGIRRRESFSLEGVQNIPHLFKDLLPEALLFPYVMNEGVTAHVNTISSLITGKWQQIDDWGLHSPTEPTLFAYLQEQRNVSPLATWVVTSNKAVTKNIGPTANVILAKQLMIEAVERIIRGQTSHRMLERDQIYAEMKAIFSAEYRRIGWSLPSHGPGVEETVYDAMDQYFNGPDAPVGGDELTFVMAREVLRQLKPSILMTNFSGVEVAHSGTYSLHLAGIRNVDSLCHRMWRFLQSDPEYKDQTTLVIMPEFGRDPDGSTTNGFFNHRSDTNINRLSWMMVLGQAVQNPGVVERRISQIDLTPSLGSILEIGVKRADGRRIEEFAI